MEVGFHALPLAIQWLIIIAAVATAYWTVWQKVVKPIALAVKKIHGTWEMVQDDHRRIAKVEKRSDELVNNSGSSLRDAVDRIEVSQVAQSKALSDHIEWGQAELLKVWQNLASRDAVEAAKKTAEMITEKEGV